MSQAETIGSFASFARWLGVAKSRITELHQAERLALTPDGRRVRFEASKVRIAETESPAHDGVRARHSAAREATAGQGAAPGPAAPVPSAAAEDEAADGDLEYQPDSHSRRRAKALADKEEAAARKAVRDEQIELGQLLRTADVEAALSDAATTLRGALEALPYDLAPELAPITDEGQLRAKLVEAIEATLAELSRRFGAMARREAA